MQTAPSAGWRARRRPDHAAPAGVGSLSAPEQSSPHGGVHGRLAPLGTRPGSMVRHGETEWRSTLPLCTSSVSAHRTPAALFCSFWRPRTSSCPFASQEVQLRAAEGDTPRPAARRTLQDAWARGHVAEEVSHGRAVAHPLLGGLAKWDRSLVGRIGRRSL